MSNENFKILVILSPGENVVTLDHLLNGTLVGKTILKLMYIPQLQTPPLHLAIMIAKDSPLLIDWFV